MKSEKSKNKIKLFVFLLGLFVHKINFTNQLFWAFWLDFDFVRKTNKFNKVINDESTAVDKTIENSNKKSSNQKKKF